MYIYTLLLLSVILYNLVLLPIILLVCIGNRVQSMKKKIGGEFNFGNYYGSSDKCIVWFVSCKMLPLLKGSNSARTELSTL